MGVSQIMTDSLSFAPSIKVSDCFANKLYFCWDTLSLTTKLLSCFLPQQINLYVKEQKLYCIFYISVPNLMVSHYNFIFLQCQMPSCHLSNAIFSPSIWISQVSSIKITFEHTIVSFLCTLLHLTFAFFCSSVWCYIWHLYYFTLSYVVTFRICIILHTT